MICIKIFQAPDLRKEETPGRLGQPLGGKGLRSAPAGGYNLGLSVLREQVYQSFWENAIRLFKCARVAETRSGRDGALYRKPQLSTGKAGGTDQDKPGHTPFPWI